MARSSARADNSRPGSVYRQAALKFHPDRNPAGAEMMKIINAAYDVLKDYAGEIEPEDAAQATGSRW